MSTQPVNTSSAADDDQKARYKATLNLPRTSFPMKANLVQNEPASIKRWEQMGLYEKALAARGGNGSYCFHDGPPYANGSIHLGHLLNKCLKDFVVRSRMLAGMRCPFVPGWDCHGLPIEHRVLQEMAAAGKLEKLASLSDDQRRMAIRRECRKYAEKYQKLQAAQMKRLLTLADYEHPYLTMSPEYEGATLEVFADLVERGLVYRRLKAVHWSPANETALAEAELEYYDREDLSVYVDFEAEDADAVYSAFGLEDESEDAEEEGDRGAGRGGRPSQRPCFMIWTTTPWTLPANMAIAVHESYEYALVRVDGNVTVIAKDLVEKVTKAAGAEDVAILATAPGRRLVGLRYVHPFVDPARGEGPVRDGGTHGAVEGSASGTRPYRIVAAPYVTLEDGTGLVHTAPGHGAEDNQTGVRENLPIYCPVRGNGSFDDTVPQWLRGMDIWKANVAIVDHLRNSGHLFFDHKFTHSYPHDWRGKTPVIFRATEQWFVGVDEPMKSGNASSASTLRGLAMQWTSRAGEDGVNFVPEWGRNRMRGMLESRPDWCISRQRAWGLPIPAFFLQDGRTGQEVVVLTPAIVRAVARVFREKGSDAWFTDSPRELLKYWDQKNDPDPDVRNVDVDALRKSGDIFDVWFESGSSWNAVLRERSGGGSRGTDYPADLYLEGSDQHRGWFQLSLLPALGVTGRPPFRTLLTHGFIVDKDGRKMSKSLGNTLEVEDLLKNFGADVCRWWVASISYEADIRADVSFFETAGEAYRKVRNTLRFMLSNLDDFDPAVHRAKPNEFSPSSLDAWVIDQFGRVNAAALDGFARFDFRAVTELLYNFCNDTLSAVYLAAVKDRLYCDRADSPRRRRTQTVLWDMTDGLCRLLSVFLPHTADEAFGALHKRGDACVHLATAPARGSPVRADAQWAGVLEIRDRALRSLEAKRKETDLDNPLDAGLVLPDPDGALARFDPVDLADLHGVSRVVLDRAATEVRVVDLRSEPRCERSWKRDGTVRRRSDGGMLCDRCATALGLAAS